MVSFLRNLSVSQIGRAAVWSTLVIAVVTLIGWFAHSPVLQALHYNSPPMVPRTALGLIFAALAVLVERRSLIKIFSGLGLGLALVILSSNILGTAFLDFSFIFTSVPTHTLVGSIETAIGLALSILSIMCLRLFSGEKPLLIGEIFCLFTLVLATLALSGFFAAATTETSIFYPAVTGMGMAFNTTLAFIFLNVGILNLGRNGRVYLFTSPTAGGVIARRLITTILIAPLILLALINHLVSWGLFEEAFRLPLALILSFSIFLAFTWVIARKVDVTETEKNQLYNQLVEKEKTYRLLLDTAPEGVFMVNSNGDCIFVNPAGEKLLGYAASELIKKNIRDLIPAEEHSRLREISLKLLHSSETYVSEWSMRKSDGEMLEVEVSARNIAKDTILAFARDIDERKRQQQLTNFKLELDSRLSNSLDYKHCIDQAVELISRKMTDFCLIVLHKKNGFLYSAVGFNSKLSDKATFSWLPLPGMLDEVNQGQQPILINRERLTQFYEQTFPPEEAKFCSDLQLASMLVLPLNSRGKIIGVVFLGSKSPGAGIELDVAQMVANRVGLYADNAILYEQATRASKDREDMVAIVSHDLKNPLAIISMSAKLLEKQSQKSGFQNEQLNSALLKINSASNYGLQLISDLLLQAKLESGKFHWI
jgi:PAS domain S-box-containing protein